MDTGMDVNAAIDHQSLKHAVPQQQLPSIRQFLSLGRAKKPNSTAAIIHTAAHSTSTSPTGPSLTPTKSRLSTSSSVSSNSNNHTAAVPINHDSQTHSPEPHSSDSSLEKELRGILEGPRWAIVYKDLPRLADRVQIRNSDGTLRRPKNIHQQYVIGKPSTATEDNPLAVKAPSANSTHSISSLGVATLPQGPTASSNIQQPLSDQSTATKSTEAINTTTATQLLLDVASQLEQPAIVCAMHQAIVDHPDLSIGDTSAVKFLIEHVLTQKSRTARLMRAINQSVVITGTWYLHQNLLTPAGVHVKDVQGADGWKVLLDFHRDRAMFVTHIRREQSLPSSTDAFELEWSIHLSFDGDAVFQGAMLKLLSFEIARDHQHMSPTRVKELMTRFCNGHELVLEQYISQHSATLGSAISGTSPVQQPFMSLSRPSNIHQRDTTTLPSLSPATLEKPSHSPSLLKRVPANSMVSIGANRQGSFEGAAAAALIVPMAFSTLPKSTTKPIPVRSSSVGGSKQCPNTESTQPYNDRPDTTLSSSAIIPCLPAISSSPLPSPTALLATASDEVNTDAVLHPFIRAPDNCIDSLPHTLPHSFSMAVPEAPAVQLLPPGFLSSATTLFPKESSQRSENTEPDLLAIPHIKENMPTIEVSKSEASLDHYAHMPSNPHLAPALETPQCDTFPPRHHRSYDDTLSSKHLSPTRLRLKSFLSWLKPVSAGSAQSIKRNV
ncbi:hypothetical protein BDEG_20271 [Batrachochytrium dendrobatidis JEL423]|uniref:Ras guanine nucleotide exchange factor glfB-like C-terminal domain-containing protein n=1 Tax=Batrachochytrium dendrobatidis (strain JEL423) TaxID=403673 RepID=A0A177W7I8_BATDL|nr:hypothetical protein BDEG_20271 [Batrachochytrium dendrobatidis JEL423]